MIHSLAGTESRNRASDDVITSGSSVPGIGGMKDFEPVAMIMSGAENSSSPADIV